MVPLFDPGPIEHPDIPVHIAAIGPDGVRLHPVCTPKFIAEAVVPALAKGAARAGRSATDVDVCMKPLVGTAANEEGLAKVTETVRARVSFYLSTPAYSRTFELHDWGDRAAEAATLSRAQRWDDLVNVVDDEMLNTVATLATHHEIGPKLRDRYGSLIDRIEFSIPVENDDDRAALTSILAEITDDD